MLSLVKWAYHQNTMGNNLEKLLEIKGMEMVTDYVIPIITHAICVVLFLFINVKTFIMAFINSPKL